MKPASCSQETIFRIVSFIRLSTFLISYTKYNIYIYILLQVVELKVFPILGKTTAQDLLTLAAVYAIFVTMLIALIVDLDSQYPNCISGGPPSFVYS